MLYTDALRPKRQIHLPSALGKEPFKITAKGGIVSQLGCPLTPSGLLALAAAIFRISESGTASRKPTPAVMGAIIFVLVAPGGPASGIRPGRAKAPSCGAPSLRKVLPSVSD